MRTRLKIGTLVVMMLVSAASARAAVILDVSSALSAADPVQLGRLSRNGIAQDWSGGEAFPGIINPITAYRYRTYVVNVGLAPYIQISVDSISVDTFVSAYDTSYLPNSGPAPNLGFNTNWLGDAGVSGNGFGNPLFFQVLLPVNHNLVIVVNQTSTGGLGLGDPFQILVERFVDSSFTEPAAVPEPASLLLGSIAIALTASRRRRRR